MAGIRKLLLGGLAISDSKWLAISDSTSRKITKISVIYKRQWEAKFRKKRSNKRQHPFFSNFFQFYFAILSNLGATLQYLRHFCMKLSNQSEAAFINVSLLFLLLKKGYEDLSTTFFKTLKWFGSLIFRKPHNDFSGFVPFLTARRCQWLIFF